MRVISGRFRGRVLKAVPGDTTRPILDRVKTALFDTLRPMALQKGENGESRPLSFLDLFGGSGSVGIEALSQGATWCTFVEMSEVAAKVIKDNLTTVGALECSEVRCMDAFAYLKNSKRAFDIIYIAPPQYKGLWFSALTMVAERPTLLNPKALVILQIDPKEREAVTLNNFVLEKEKQYGNTILLMYRFTDGL
jgi:16S rRNA (guanine966-N2)-methyltransferase